jgi:hypothetical protein
MLMQPGRRRVAVVMGSSHPQRGHRICTPADLISCNRLCYLTVVIDGFTPPPREPDDGLGVDRGMSTSPPIRMVRPTRGSVIGWRKRHP